MKRITSRLPLAGILVSGLLVLQGCSDTPDSGGILDPVAPDVEANDGTQRLSTSLRMVSRNLYLGADITPVFQADFSNPLSVITAGATVWAQVLTANADERMSAIADEIERENPQMVGVQEAFRFIHLDGSGAPTGLIIDLLAELERELQDRGLDYVTVAVQNNTTATLPIAVDLSTGVPVVTELVNFTDRIAVLARADVPVSGVDQSNYATGFPLAPGVELTRGWIRVDTEHDGINLHFVNTHLEGQSLAPVQAGQASELRDQVLEGLDGVTVLVGDLNSDAEALPGDPSWTPTYGDLISVGFVDAWEQGGKRKDPGFTCCQDPDLRNDASALDQRLDFVLLRTALSQGADGRIPGRVDASIIGRDQADRTSPTSLWPSDHAGLLVGLRLPSGLFGGQ